MLALGRLLPRHAKVEVIHGQSHFFIGNEQGIEQFISMAAKQVAEMTLLLSKRKFVYDYEFATYGVYFFDICSRNMQLRLLDHLRFL